MLFVVFLFAGYAIVTESSFFRDTSGQRDANKDPSIEAYEKNRKERIANLTKYNLYDETVASDEYGIIDSSPSLDTNQLLSRENWTEKTLGSNNLHILVPNDGWYVQSSTSSNQIVLTTSEDGSVAEDAPWARITIGEYKRNIEQSLFEWMRDPMTQESEITPPQNKTVQYVSIGENMFLGSAFFEDNTWVGSKNAYAEVNIDAVFAASLEVENLTPSHERLGEFDQVFYTILESLEVK